MTPPSPYNLERDAIEGDFQSALSELADEFLLQAERMVGDLIDGHVAFLEAGGTEPVRSRGEYAVELLSLGLLRREYSTLAAITPPGILERLAELWTLRSTNPTLKPVIDEQRGRLFMEILANRGLGAPPPPADDAPLVRWLAATGEFVQESLRFGTWLAGTEGFWSSEELTLPTEDLAQWFVSRASKRLGAWTRGVAGFRQSILERGTPREDLFLITRSEPLYHLNMVGSEIMNRGFLPGFQKRSKKILLVPGCMRALHDDACGAHREGLDFTCARCHEGCEVAALDKLGEENGFSVYIVPHASTFTAWLEHWSRDPGAALIAAACPLHLVTGGYEMRAFGLQAQCILLQYSGCSRHWDPAGTPTRLDRSRLLSLMAEDRP